MEQHFFPIGEVAKMIGITPETIRHYERKHVFTPTQRKENNYRFFSMADVCAINQVRSFLRYGFSIDEAQELLNSDQVEETEYALMNRAAMLEKTITEQMQVVNIIHQRLLDIQSVIANIGKYRQVEADRIYLIPAFHGTGEPLRETDSEILRWFNNQPVAYPYTLLCQDAIWEGHARVRTMGMCVLERDRQKFQLAIPDESCRLDMGRCLYTGVRMGEHTPEKEALVSVAQHLRECKLETAGDALGRTVVVQREAGEKVYYMELLIPLKDSIFP